LNLHFPKKIQIFPKCFWWKNPQKPVGKNSLTAHKSMHFCGSRCPVAENVGSQGNPMHGSHWSFLTLQGSTSAR
jgi:hypothetical protein